MSTVPPAPAAVPLQPARPRWPLAGVVVLAVVAFYALGLDHYFDWNTVRSQLGAWNAEVHEHFLAVMLVYFAIYVAVTALSLPVAAIASLVGGALFGRWLGTAVVSIGSTLGATLAFLSSRYVFRDWVEQRFGQRLQPLRRGIERDGAYYLFTLRLVPVAPFFLINLAMGLTRMSTWTYTWVSMIGMLPGTFLYVYAGEALAEVESPEGLLSRQVLFALALLGVVPLAIRKLVRPLAA